LPLGICKKIGGASYFGRVAIVLVLTKFGTRNMVLCDPALRIARFLIALPDCIFSGATFAHKKKLAFLGFEKFQSFLRKRLIAQ